jgi:hypothetical protein
MLFGSWKGPAPKPLRKRSARQTVPNDSKKRRKCSFICRKFYLIVLLETQFLLILEAQSLFDTGREERNSRTDRIQIQSQTKITFSVSWL